MDSDVTVPAPPADKACPRCAETVKAAARICRFCGYSFEPGGNLPTRVPPVETVVTRSFGQHEWFLAWALASALFMVIGSFGPWVRALAMTASGTDGGNDGWVVVAVAVIGGLLLILTRRYRAGGLWALLGGVIGSVITIHDRGTVSHAISTGGAFTSALVQVGWGLNLAMISSISFAICGLIWLFVVPNKDG